MRKALLPLALLLAVRMHAAGPADFSGQWSLDRSQSKDLPPFYEEVKSHSLKITQNEKELVVGVDITSDAHEPLHIDFTYSLDGQPTKTESQVRTPNGPLSVPTILTAKPADDGKIGITIERDLPSPRSGEPMKGTTVETWRLQDAKTLVIDRVDETRRGTMTSTLVFTRSQ